MRRLIFEPEHEQFRDTVRRFFQKEVAPGTKLTDACPSWV